MWHETRPEMLEMLKSLLRLDNDQCLKLSAKKCVNDPEAEANFYTYEGESKLWYRLYKKTKWSLEKGA